MSLARIIVPFHWKSDGKNYIKNKNTNAGRISVFVLTQLILTDIQSMRWYRRSLHL